MTAEPVRVVGSHVRLPFRFTVSPLTERFAEGLRRSQIHGTRCVACRGVWVPPRAFCSRCFQPCEGWERVADAGVVATFVVVNVPFHGQNVDIPYVLAHVLLDGADSEILHLVGSPAPNGRLAPPMSIGIGARVRAVWRKNRTGFINEDIDHFEPG